LLEGGPNSSGLAVVLGDGLKARKQEAQAS